MNDDKFDVAAKTCLDGGTLGARRDLVLALDRSQNVWGADSGSKKLGADQISTALYIIDKLHAEAKVSPQTAPRLSVVLFSSAPDCREYTGGPIAVNREFPCLFAAGRSIGDESHVQLLKEMLRSADKKYSQGGLPRTSDFTIVAGLLASDRLAMSSAGGTSMVLFSDARTYSGAAGDVYAYLRSGSYLAGQNEALLAFNVPAVRRVKTVVALAPLATPVFGPTHADAYDTMCALPSAAQADCDPATVSKNNAKSWPVNKLDIRGYAAKLGQTVTLTKKEDIDAGLESLRIESLEAAPLDAVSFTADGGAPRPGRIEGMRVILESIPAGTRALEVSVSSGGREVKFPMSLALTQVPFQGVDLVDAEMVCTAPAPATDGPKLRLDDLQGGSGSCGVAGGGNRGSMGLVVLMLGLPLIAALAFSGVGAKAMALLALIAGGMTILPSRATAEEKNGGLNALMYRPVVDGVASTEKAAAIAPGTFNVGLFYDYSNDAVELGGEKGKRIASVMDDLVTAHAAFNLGLFDRVAIGAHLPFVHMSDVDRALDGSDVKGGRLGRPADAAAMLKISIVRKPNYTLGVMPMATIPTGDPELLLGDGSASFGAMLLASGTNDELSWAVATGYMQRDEALELADDRARTVKVRGQGVLQTGVEYRLSPLLSFGGNLQLKVSAGEGLDLTRTNPAEWHASAKVRPLGGLELQTGFGTGLGKGYGSPDYRIFAGVTYVPEASTRRVADAAPAAAPAPAPAPAAVLVPAAAKPVAKPAVAPAASKPAVKPAAAPAPKPSAKPAAKPAAVKPAPKKAAAAKPARR